MRTTLYFLLYAISVLLAPCINAQSGQWTWLKGSQTPQSTGSFGTQGIAAPANTPPALVNHFFWTANDGTFWLFGGQDSGGDGQAALWKYDPVANMWTWVKGPNTADFEGVFGTQGVESPTNLPPAKTFGGASWVDFEGNFWMYGGENGDNYNFNANNDLWRYRPATGNWTWMKGSTLDDQPAVWGTLGVPENNNQPPPKTNCYGTWTDDAGDLWLFGGLNNQANETNDLWRYNIATNTWTWMNGSQTPGADGVYGTLGVQDATNTPGARVAYSAGKDEDGKLWLIGGGYASGSYGWNDVWRLDPVTGHWTWMDGSSVPNPSAIHGTYCTPAATNEPGRRPVCATWRTNDGRIWKFGVDSDSGNPNQNYTRNDTWSYCTTTLEWSWIHGPSTLNAPAVYGTQGVPSPANRPIGRSMPSAWVGNNGDLYMFGGLTDGFFAVMNDLWRFTPDPTCAPCTSSTGIQEPFDADLTIAPVPCIGHDLSVTLPPGPWTLTIIDATGRSATPDIARSGATTLDVSGLSDGAYVLLAISGSERLVRRFIIAR